MPTISDALHASATAHPIPGFVAAAIVDGAVVHESVHGLRDPATTAPMTADTVFRIFSMTKAVTTVAVLQLVELGRIALDDPAGRYAPDIDQSKVLTGFDAAGAPVLRAPKRAVTIRDLLNHTSGFGYDMWNADIGKYIAATGTAPLASGLKAALKLPLMFDPGERWEYGVGVDWAGLVVEAVSGQQLDAYFTDHIFAPLGMDSTGFAPTDAMASRMAGMSMRGEDGALIPLPFGGVENPELLSGGGGLLSTAGDYLKFLQALAGDGQANGARLLRPETVDQLGAHGPSNPPVRPLATAVPFLTNNLDIWGAYPPQASLGFMINPETGPHGRGAGSLAWAGLANTYYWVDRPRRLAGVFMTQLFPFADKNALAVFADFERAVYGAIDG